MAKSARGVLLPEPGDPLLEGLGRAFGSAGVVTPAASIPAARELIARGVRDGAGPTVEHPWYFLINKIMYVCSGGKGLSGEWQLSVVNEVDVDQQIYTLGVSSRLSPNQFSGMCTSQLPERPYRRVVMAFGQAWGRAADTVDLCINVNGGLNSLARFDADNTEQSTSCVGYGILEPGVRPQVVLGVRGGSRGGQFWLSRDAQLNRFLVVAFPVSTA